MKIKTKIKKIEKNIVDRIIIEKREKEEEEDVDKEKKKKKKNFIMINNK